MEEQKEHKRRVRYKGTHPRNYNEKYKELNPEKYQGTIEHVIQKGSTPAGMHIPILVEEILDFLKIEPGQNGLDATLGYGGPAPVCLHACREKGISVRWMSIRSRWQKQKNDWPRRGTALRF